MTDTSNNNEKRKQELSFIEPKGGNYFVSNNIWLILPSFAKDNDNKIYFENLGTGKWEVVESDLFEKIKVKWNSFYDLTQKDKFKNQFIVDEDRKQILEIIDEINDLKNQLPKSSTT